MRDGANVTLQTGGTLAIGTGTGQQITTTGTVDINSGGGVTEAAGSGIVAPNLRLRGTGTFALANSVGTSPETVTNNVGTLRGQPVGGRRPDVHQPHDPDRQRAAGHRLGAGHQWHHGGQRQHHDQCLELAQRDAADHDRAANSTANVHIGLGVTPGTLPTTPNVAADAGTAITLNRTDVNDPPVTQGSTIVAAQNTLATPFSYTFQASDFSFSDPVDSPQNNLLAVKFTLPLGFKGTIKDGATTINSGDLVLETAHCGRPGDLHADPQRRRGQSVHQLPVPGAG